MSEYQKQLPVFPYTEREAIRAEAAVAILFRESEFHPDTEQCATIKQFGESLMTGPVDSQGKPIEKPLASVMKAAVLGDEQQYDLDFLMSGTDEARNACVALGIPSDVSKATLKSTLCGMATAHTLPLVTIRRKVETVGKRWRTARITAALAEDATCDSEFEPDEIITLHAEPSKVLEKINTLQSYRRWYAGIAAELAASAGADPAVLRAKQTVLKLQREKVNATLALLYPHAESIREQLENTPRTADEGTAVVEAGLENLHVAVPVMRHVSDKHQSNFMRRLDLVRNGAALASDGTYSPVSEDALQLANDIEHSAATRTIEAPFSLPEKAVELMRGVTWGSAEVREFVSAVLTDWGELSEYTTTWDEVAKRSGSAEDGRWQVVVTDARDTLEVLGKKRIFVIPKTFLRGLLDTSPAGALPSIAHELGHILQNTYDGLLAEQVPLAAIQGRRHLTTCEMGGIYEERMVHAIAGQTRPTNTTYLRALQAKLKGANELEVARAFLKADSSAADLATKQARAADRIQRLYRNGGYSSQPLDYLEQDLLVASMEHLPADEVRKVALVGGSFALPDVAELHRLGLLELPTDLAHRPAEEVMQLYLSRFATDEVRQIMLDDGKERQ